MVSPPVLPSGTAIVNVAPHSVDTLKWSPATSSTGTRTALAQRAEASRLSFSTPKLAFGCNRGQNGYVKDISKAPLGRTPRCPTPELTQARRDKRDGMHGTGR
eukprot:scaffold30005_cov66-Phaeocystis_antarctica.AAC.8